MKPVALCRTLLLSLLMLAACTVAAQSDLYRRYAQRTDVRVAFIEAMRVDSVTTVDVTVVTAVDSAGWQWMMSEFNIPSFSPEIEAFLASGEQSVSLHFSPSGRPDRLAKPAETSPCDAVVVDRAHRTLCAYHIADPAQYRRILRRELDAVANPGTGR